MGVWVSDIKKQFFLLHETNNQHNSTQRTALAPATGAATLALVVACERECSPLSAKDRVTCCYCLQVVLGRITNRSETTDPRDSKTTDPTRKPRPLTQKLPSPSVSETTDQRLGNYPSTTRKHKNMPTATRKLPLPSDSETTITRLRNYLPRLGN